MKQIIKNGYRIIYKPNCPYARKGKAWKGFVLEHRYVWFKHHGLFNKGCIIHHIDGNRLNNQIGNLLLMTHEEHTSLHGAGSKKPRIKKEKPDRIELLHESLKRD